MNGYYSLLSQLKNHFDTDVLTNTVTQGNIFAVDLGKQTIFPLVHIMVNQITLNDNVLTANVTLLCMDNVSQRKEEAPNNFENADNEIDVLNTTFLILNRAFEKLKHGTMWDNMYKLRGAPTCEPFTERFENYLAGWAMTFDVDYPNDMDVC
jgi:hypothetical protein